MNQIHMIQIVLGLVSFMLVRSREVGRVQALALVLWGFYMSWSPFEAQIVSAVGWVVGALSH